MGQAVGGAQVVVEPGVDPRLKVLPAPGGVDVRRPCDRERVHAVLVFQQMGGIKAVLSAAARHKAVVAAVGFAVAIAQFPKLALPVGPVNFALLVVAGVAGVAHPVFLDDHGLFLRMDGMLELVTAVGLLVGHHALFAVPHIPGQAEEGLPLFGRDVRGIFGIVDGDITGKFFHDEGPFFHFFITERQGKGALRAGKKPPLPGGRLCPALCCFL